jgi:hypothetical protein
MGCTYKKQEVNPPSSGTPTSSVAFLRGILPGLRHPPSRGPGGRGGTPLRRPGEPLPPSPQRLQTTVRSACGRGRLRFASAGPPVAQAPSGDSRARSLKHPERSQSGAGSFRARGLRPAGPATHSELPAAPPCRLWCGPRSRNTGKARRDREKEFASSGPPGVGCAGDLGGSPCTQRPPGTPRLLTSSWRPDTHTPPVSCHRRLPPLEPCPVRLGFTRMMVPSRRPA